jgi:hypothetical protein
VAGAGARAPLAVRVLPLDASNYQRHSLHGDDRVWVEKNCYIDVWIEAVHALGCDPLAMLGFTAAIDFEGDQWTFFKPSHDEIRELYGIDVQELNIWRPLRDHSAEHVGAGKLISTEADAFYLPDTAGTDYQRQHTKTTIIINELDLDKRRLGYFHNAAYYALEGEDFVHTFRVGYEPDPKFMPLFAEVLRVDRMVKRPLSELQDLARGYLKRAVNRRPADNPVRRFAARFMQDLSSIQSEGLAFYHAWAFATIRQLGAAMELLAGHLKWLGQESAPFEQISNLNKTFILKAARAVNAKRALDAAPMFDEMAAAWQAGMAMLSG